MATAVYARSEGLKFNADAVLVPVTCATCHMLYAIPDSLEQSARRYPGSRGGWKLTCPLGHTWYYVGQSVEEKLEQERRRAGRFAAQRDQAEASARGYRGAATCARNERDRVRRRAAAGVCPCCNRTFKQLARHMKGQHPDYPVPDSESAV